MKRTFIFIAIFGLFATVGSAQKNNTEQELIKQADSFFNKGEYLQAFPLYSQLVSLYPQDPNYNYRFGTCAISGQPDKSQAIKHLTFATRKEVSDPKAWYFLGKAYHLNYQFKEAIQAYQDFEKKADPKLREKYNSARDIEMCTYGTGLLSNMKDVVVLNKVEGDRENFFRYFNIEDVGGKILTVPAELLTKIDIKSGEPGVMFYPANSTTIYFSSYGNGGNTGKDIYTAQVLPDGKFSSPLKLEGGVNSKYDEDYCFMHSDGKTFYFSSKGHNSMGGYDIFKAIYDPTSNSFGPAINLDFAINTPDDDIFYITDKDNEKAYFASARTSDLDHLHIYNVLVKGIPSQVIYIKGEFISELNADQRNARIVVKEASTDRPVLDAYTNGSTGSYILYVPKSGDYKFFVTTENSPIIHQGNVKIPAYDHPVALRQEMRLVKENGVEKLIINNFFDQPLEEDLAGLAADMLRKKAGLEINATDELIREVENENPSEEILVEKTIQNAPIAAGFAEGVSIQKVIADMENELRSTSIFVSESYRKSELAYAYALKKQQEADATLKQAENLRNNTSSYLTEDDVTRLRKSHALSNEASMLKAEATSAMAAAEVTKQYGNSESGRAKQLQENIDKLNQANTTSNFDDALTALRAEKQRLSERRGVNQNQPYEELLTDAKTSATAQQNAESKIEQLRNDEMKLMSQLTTAEQNMGSAKKKADKAMFETEYATTKSTLDLKRKEIIKTTIQAEKLNAETEEKFGVAEFFLKLYADKTSLDLPLAEQRTLSDVEKTGLSMKLSEMNNRLDAMEITNPQMLALVGEPIPSNEATPNAVPLESIKASHESLLARAGDNNPTTPSVKRMAANHSLGKIENQIIALESKKTEGLSAREESNLNELKIYRTELQSQIKNTNAVDLPAAELRLAYNEVSPGYDNQLQEINNTQGTALDHVTKSIELNAATLVNLERARTENAEKAYAEVGSDELTAIAKKDQQLEAAITAMESQSQGIAPYKTAFAEGNLQIIESDTEFSQKLKQQVEMSEQYAAELDKLESTTKTNLESNTDTAEEVRLENQLVDINQEQEWVVTKLEGYKADLELTINTAPPKENDTAAVVDNTVKPVKTLEEEIEESFESETEENNEHGDEEAAKSKEQKDAELIKELFTKTNEEESIISYETGALDEIIAEHECDSMKVENRDKIAEIQDQIFIAEAEMENEKSEIKQRKLDRDAEKLYLKKSLLEMNNAPAIGKMTMAEYNQQFTKIEKLNAENKVKVDSRIMIRDEVRSLFNKAKDEMEDAQILRKKAGPVVDDIERNDYYRRAFAKEMYAIRLLGQLEEVHKNIDTLLEYSEQELSAMRYGKVLPKPEEATATAVENSDNSSLGIIEKRTTPAEAGNNATAANNTPATNTAITPAKTTTTPANPITPVNKTVTVPATTASAANNALPAAPVFTMKSAQPLTQGTATADAVATNILSTSQGQMNKSDLMTSSPFNDYMALSAVAAGSDMRRLELISERNMMVSESKKADAKIKELELAKASAKTDAERDGLQAEINALTNQKNAAFATIASKDKEIESLEVAIKSGTDKAASLYTGLINTSKSTASAPAYIPAAPAYTPAAAAGAYSRAESEGMFYNFPATLEKDLFVTTNASVYSEAKPIPVDAYMPMGTYYKVQIGAFRNNIPQNLYDEFAPVSGESLSNGITRYTAGFFVNYKNADAVKKLIRQVGYADAFIVAYRDGKRIPLYEAIGKTDGEEFAALIENEYVNGDSAPKKVAPAAANTATSNTGYYARYNNAAPATEIESINGLFYTVQVGVYSKAVSASDLHNVNPLCVELNDKKKFRYTSGIFTELQSAVNKRGEARTKGVGDAFVTAYFNGKRISLTEADRLVKENGPSVFTTVR